MKKLFSNLGGGGGDHFKVKNRLAVMRSWLDFSLPRLRLGTETICKGFNKQLLIAVL